MSQIIKFSCSYNNGEAVYRAACPLSEVLMELICSMSGKQVLKTMHIPIVGRLGFVIHMVGDPKVARRELGEKVTKEGIMKV